MSARSSTPASAAGFPTGPGTPPAPTSAMDLAGPARVRRAVAGRADRRARSTSASPCAGRTGRRRRCTAPSGRPRASCGCRSPCTATAACARRAAAHAGSPASTTRGCSARTCRSCTPCTPPAPTSRRWPRPDQRVAQPDHRTAHDGLPAGHGNAGGGGAGLVLHRHARHADRRGRVQPRCARSTRSSIARVRARPAPARAGYCRWRPSTAPATSGSATVTGSLTPGKRADLVLLDAPRPTCCPPAILRGTGPAGPRRQHHDRHRRRPRARGRGGELTQPSATGRRRCGKRAATQSLRGPARPATWHSDPAHSNDRPSRQRRHRRCTVTTLAPPGQRATRPAIAMFAAAAAGLLGQRDGPDDLPVLLPTSGPSTGSVSTCRTAGDDVRARDGPHRDPGAASRWPGSAARTVHRHRHAAVLRRHLLTVVSVGFADMLAWRVLSGAGEALQLGAILTVAAGAFPRHRGLAIGAVNMAFAPDR